MREQYISSPIHVTIYKPKRKVYAKYALNFNRFREGIGIHLYGRLKKEYSLTMKPLIEKLTPIKGRVRIEYILYVGSSHKSDVMNWISVTDKFFQDALKEYGIIEDDNSDIVPEISAKFGGISRKDPRVDVTLIQLD